MTLTTVKILFLLRIIKDESIDLKLVKKYK